MKGGNEKWEEKSKSEKRKRGKFYQAQKKLSFQGSLDFKHLSNEFVHDKRRETMNLYLERCRGKGLGEERDRIGREGEENRTVVAGKVYLLTSIHVEIFPFLLI